VFFSCSFHSLAEELAEGHCVGGGCKIHEHGSVISEIGIDQQTQAIVNEPVPEPEPEASPAAQTEAELAPGVAVEEAEDNKEEVAEIREAGAEAEAEAAAPAEEKKSRFGRAKRA
jgi:hypothetical protein